MQEVNVKFMDAFAKGDAEAVAALYTSDCKVMPTGSDIVEGQQGTYSIWRPQIKDWSLDHMGHHFIQQYWYYVAI